MKKLRLAFAKPIWAVHDWACTTEPLNRLGCYIAWGRDWRTKYDAN